MKTAIARIDATSPAELAITVTTVVEQVAGRLGYLKRCRSEAEIAHACQLLRDTVSRINQFQIIEYGSDAQSIFESLRQSRIRIGSQDMRIAAITLSVGGILVTRNAVDFGKVPGLTIQDWTV
ncbi:MAG: type II toxin-antitoxin system VapC family toxin [Blastocatellia bacterium]